VRRAFVEQVAEKRDGEVSGRTRAITVTVRQRICRS